MSYYRTAEQSPRVIRTYRAALYIRLSKEDGDKTESDSVVNQKRLLTGFVDRQPDIDVHDCYIDDGCSGATFNRPDFLRMMADVYAGRVNCVIVKDSSRFGRNASESGRYIGEIFPKLQVRYIAVNDAIDSGRSQGAAIDFLNNSMRGMINEYYVAANSESIRSTLDMERRKGDFIGSFAKYGYKKDPADRHKLVIDEEAAAIVRLIYRMYLSGTGIRAIVRHLNDSAVVNPSTYKRQQGMNFKSRSIGGSALWSDKTVRRTLRDEMYIGNMVQGKFRKISYKDKAIRACSEDDWIRVCGTHEPIISAEDFVRVQRMLDRRAKASPVTGEVDLFSGLLRCADCGHALIKKTSHNPDKTYVYYRCSTYNKCKGACTAHTLRYERLYQCVLGCIQRMVDIAVNADEVMKQLKEKQTADTNGSLKIHLEKQKAELNRVMQRMADLYTDFKDGVINAEPYRMNKEKYEQEQTRLQASLAKLNASLGSGELSDRTNDFVEHFKRHGSIDRLTRPLLTELIDQITVCADGTLDITFNFCDAFARAQQLTNDAPA